jgi:quinol monooxygenase YgiN
MSDATIMTRRRFFFTTTAGAGIMAIGNSDQLWASPAMQRGGAMPTGNVVTLLFSVTVKEAKAEEFHDVAARLTTTTRAQDDGCLAYVFLQQEDAPREYVLYEQWRDQSALDAHLVRVQAMLGPPNPGGRLPKTFLDLCEKTSAVRYRPLA